MTTFDQEVHKLANEVADLVIKKQRDYGPKNILNSVVEPEIGIAVRLTDKLARLVNLKTKGATPNNESLRDTWMDIIGYGLVGLMVNDQTFLTPLEEEKKDEA